ncbi:hypothetical protein AURDEDRAFT_184260 [Auricularia subglabra TFB-10046 SS5]|nr:hypothetical protein AURDEDRAFT_184260 [Auricularia subglabra TFB-10046 SS5]
MVRKCDMISPSVGCTLKWRIELVGVQADWHWQWPDLAHEHFTPYHARRRSKRLRSGVYVTFSIIPTVDDGVDDDAHPPVVTRLLSALERLSLPVVTAESCSAGALASALTSKPASPSLCLGGVTSYSPLFKNAVLGVPEDIIRSPGEVSEECARAMARSVLLRAGLLDVNAEHAFKHGALLERAQGIGVSTTGYLDNVPDGEQQEVFIGCHWLFDGRQGTRVERMNVGHVRGHPLPDAGNVGPEDADRNERKETVVTRALDVLLEVVEQLEQNGRAPSERRDDSLADVRRAQRKIDDLQAAQV